MKKRRDVTILIIPEGSTRSYGKKISYSTLYMILAAAAVIVGAFTFMVVNYSRVYYTALQVEMVRRRNQRLEEQWKKIGRMERDLALLRRTDQKIRKMLGTDISLSIGTSLSPAAVDSRREESTSLGGPSAEEAAADSMPGAAMPLDQIPTIWPVRGWISRSYSQNHTALDIAAPTGTPVVATISGVVARAGWNDTYGRLIEIDNEQGFHVAYGHNSRLLVREGEVVSKGEVIAFVGSTGLSSGAHLHYEVHLKGKAVDPFRYLVQ